MKKMYAILLAVIGALIVLCVVVGIESCSNKKERDSQTTEATESTTEEATSESTSEKETKTTETEEQTSSIVESLSYTTAYEFSVFKIKEIKDDRVLTVELYESDEEFDTKNFNLRTFDFSSYKPTGLEDDDYKVFSFYIIYKVKDEVYYLGNFDDLHEGDMFCYMEDASGHCYMFLYE